MSEMMMKKLIFLILAAVLLGCNTMPPSPPATAADKQRVYQIDYDVLFNAVKAVLVENECIITTASKDGGVLRGEKRTGSAAMQVVMFGETERILTHFDITFLIGESITVCLETYCKYRDSGHKSAEMQDAYLNFWAQLEEKLASK